MSEPGLPTTWREAVPYLIWIVLVLGFGLEFTTNVIHGNWLLAILSFCAMAGLAAVTLHWPQLRSWAMGVSPNWVVGSSVTLLIVIALLPVAEQSKSLFSAWFPANAVDGAQKSTLMEWLQQAQRERDEAKQGAAAVEAQKATLMGQIQQAQRERDDARQELNQLQKQTQDARLRANSAIPLPGRQAPNPRVCVELLQLRSKVSSIGANKHEWDVFADHPLDEDILSVMKSTGCLSD